MKTKVLTLMIISIAMIVTASAMFIRNAGDVFSSAGWVYIGTYTQKEPHVNGKADGVYVYEMNPETGVLTYVMTSPKTVNPSYVAVHPNGKWLYAVNETGDGKVSSFRIDRDKKKIEFLNMVSAHGSAPCYISVDQSGKFVLVANYGSGNVTMYPLNTDGSLKEAVVNIQHEGKGPDAARQEGPHAHMIISGNQDNLIYAVDLGIDKVITYKLDTRKASLEKTSEYNAVPGAGPRHIEFHRNKKWAYIVNELNGTIEACTVDPASGALTRFQVISTIPEGEKRKAASAAIHITPSGKYLYASNRGEINNIAMFTVDENTGRLRLIGYQNVKGKIPRSFAIDPSGKFLLVANQDTDNIITFKIDNSTGKLLDTGIEANVPTPVCVKFE